MGARLLRGLVIGAVVLSGPALVTGASAQTTAHATTTACTSSLVDGAKGPIHLTVWTGLSGPATAAAGVAVPGTAAAFADVVAAFNAVEKGRVVVTAVAVPGTSPGLWASYYTAMHTSSAPNLILLDSGDAQAALDTGTLVPASTCVAATATSLSRFSPRVLDAYKSGKTLIGLPYAATVPVMVENTAALLKAHLARTPVTLATVMADQRTLMRDGERDGVSLQYDPWEITAWAGLDNDLLVNHSNGHNDRATTAVFGDDKDLLTYLSDLQTIARAANGRNVDNPTSPNATQQFGNLVSVLNGNAAIAFAPTTDVAAVAGSLSKFPHVTLGVTRLPALTATDRGAIPVSGAGLFMNSSNSSASQVAAAWTFVQFATSVHELATFDAATGYLPVRSDEIPPWRTVLAERGVADKEPALASWFEAGESVLMSGATTPATEGALVGAYTAMNNDLQTALQTLLTAPFTTTPAEALTNAAFTASSDITSYNQNL